MEVVDLLAADAALPHRNFDHALTGDWVDHRDCHIKPDLVLIYRKPPTSLSLCASVLIASLIYECMTMSNSRVR